MRAPKTRQNGFTIIEVMLFLAVSSLLTIGIFAGASANINNQRYTDAVRSFRAFVQEQYIATVQIQNLPHSADARCPITSVAETTLPRGTSNCEIVGKLITVENDGSDLRTNDIVGLPPTDSTATTDLAELKAYTLAVVEDNSEVTPMRWETLARLKAERSSALLNSFQIILLRSPLESGTLLAFTRSGTTTNIEEFIGELNTAQVSNSVICIDPKGLSSSQVQAITIKTRGSVSNAVEQGVDESCVV